MAWLRLSLGEIHIVLTCLWTCMRNFSRISLLTWILLSSIVSSETKRNIQLTIGAYKSSDCAYDCINMYYKKWILIPTQSTWLVCIEYYESWACSCHGTHINCWKYVKTWRNNYTKGGKKITHQRNVCTLDCHVVGCACVLWRTEADGSLPW